MKRLVANCDKPFYLFFCFRAGVMILDSFNTKLEYHKDHDHETGHCDHGRYIGAGTIKYQIDHRSAHGKAGIVHSHKNA